MSHAICHGELQRCQKCCIFVDRNCWSKFAFNAASSCKNDHEYISSMSHNFPECGLKAVFNLTYYTKMHLITDTSSKI